MIHLLELIVAAAPIVPIVHKPSFADSFTSLTSHIQSLEGTIGLEETIRQECRDLISASYDLFHAAVLQNPFGILYQHSKKQAAAALRKELYARAEAADSDKERKLYLNYARVAHLHFAQKTKELDKVVASHNLDAPEPQQYSCSTVPSKPSGFFSYITTALSLLPLMAMLRGRKGEEENKDDDIIELPSAPDDNYNNGGVFTLNTLNDNSSFPTNQIVISDRTGYVDCSHNNLDARPWDDETFTDEDEPTDYGYYSCNVRVPQDSAQHQSFQKREGWRFPRFLSRVVANHFTLTFALIGACFYTTVYPSLTYNVQQQRQEQEVVVYRTPASVPSSTLHHDSSTSVLDTSPITSTPALSHTISYDPIGAPAYDAQNPAQWYQIEKAELSNNGRTLDLRLGPDLSGDGKTVRVRYVDGQFTRVKYLDAEASLSFNVPSNNGRILDAGVGVRGNSSFTYLSSVRL